MTVHRFLVRQQFDETSLPKIPSNYLLIEDGRGYIHLRNALLMVREHKLVHRFTDSTFNPRLTRWAGSSEGFDEMYPPILSTMKFEPWSTFVVTRRVGRPIYSHLSKSTHAAARHPHPQAFASWLTYFCFSSEKDAALFKMVWRE